MDWRRYWTGSLTNWRHAILAADPCLYEWYLGCLLTAVQVCQVGLLFLSMRVAKPSAAQRNVKVPIPAACNLKVEPYRPGRTRFAYMMALYLFLQISGGEVRFRPQEVPERCEIQGVLWPPSANWENLNHAHLLSTASWLPRYALVGQEQADDIVWPMQQRS